MNLKVSPQNYYRICNVVFREIIVQKVISPTVLIKGKLKIV